MNDKFKKNKPASAEAVVDENMKPASETAVAGAAGQGLLNQGDGEPNETVAEDFERSQEEKNIIAAAAAAADEADQQIKAQTNIGEDDPDKVPQSVDEARAAAVDDALDFVDDQIEAAQAVELTAMAQLPPRYGFMNETCEHCVFQKDGKCRRYPATIEKGGEMGGMHIYSTHTEYKSISKKIIPKRNENNESADEYEARAEIETKHEYNAACGEFLSIPVVISADVDSIKGATDAKETDTV